MRDFFNGTAIQYLAFKAGANRAASDALDTFIGDVEKLSEEYAQDYQRAIDELFGRIQTR